jgi:hypothetical protein
VGPASLFHRKPDHDAQNQRHHPTSGSGSRQEAALLKPESDHQIDLLGTEEADEARLGFDG